LLFSQVFNRVYTKKLKEIPLEKYFVLDFHNWNVKFQTQLMNKNLWGIVNRNEQSPTDPNKLLKW